MQHKNHWRVIGQMIQINQYTTMAERLNFNNSWPGLCQIGYPRSAYQKQKAKTQNGFKHADASKFKWAWILSP
jgi:hypothetical protein